MGLFVKLDVTWVDSPKIVLAPMAVRGCHATAMCIAKRTEADGWFMRALLVREGADEALIADLVERGLLEVEGDRVRPFGWLDRNPSQAAIGAKRASKAEAGKRGNHTRWHSGDYDTCTLCHVDDALVIAGSDRTSSHTDTVATPSHSPDTDTDLETDLRSHLTSVPDHPGFAGPRPAGLDIARAAAGSGDSLRAGEAR